MAVAVIFKTNAARIAARYRKRARKLTPELAAAQKASGSAMVARLKRMSSATAYVVTHRPPYPYSRSEPAPPLPPYLLNIQTGKLKGGWRYRTLVRENSIGTTFYNLADYSRFMTELGTRRMIGRPIIEKALQETHPEIVVRYHKNLLRVLIEESGE